MKFQFLCTSRVLIILLIVFCSSLNGDISVSKSESSQVSLVGNRDGDFKGLALPAGRSPLFPPAKPSTALIVAPDQNGTIHLVESGSMRIIWSFPTGSPIYGSYQAPVNKDNDKENASGPSNEFIDVGDDWSLYQRKPFGKMRLLTSIEDIVKATPKLSNDGVLTLGSKRITVFEVDAKTGRIFRSYTASDFDNAFALWSDDRQSVQNILTTENEELVKSDPLKLHMPEPLLMLFRTDYSLQAVSPGSEKVAWSMTVAEFEAVLYCQHNENPMDGALFDSEGKYACDSGLDFALPYPCWVKQKVYRLPKSFPVQPSIVERFPEATCDNEMLPMPHADLMLPVQPNNHRFLNGDDNIMMLPMPVPDLLPPLLPQRGNSDDTFELPPHLTQIATREEVNLKGEISWLKYLLLVLFMVSILVLIFPSLKLIWHCSFQKLLKKGQNSEFDLKSTLKRKKTRKSGKSSGIVDKKVKPLVSEDDKSMPHCRDDKEPLLYVDKADECADGRKIGKLFVSNKEIAKGSNGTIVLEGTYECRVVAVKRLVQAHHDEAFKEIQNLIASDYHPNIVRWFGVENDQDFVYLALERCSCNLDDLIQLHSDIAENSVLSKNETLKAQLEIGKKNMQNLWKANGFPSPLLLKLMRDIVSGLCHLHELGMVHRDLKPQNILIINERSLCAKLSDMGISKRLLEDMSSFGHNGTGCGSSGWQAPEQLVQGRQTRAVDLFSLGCVLFFCITGGRHPFGERLERDFNIVRNQKDLFLVDYIPEAEDLISCLLNPEPDLRPKAVEVLHHPFFWDSEMRLSFLRDASDRVELEDRETNSDLLKALEGSAPAALNGNWDEKMEPTFIANIGRYRRYKYDSVRDLLRVMRNKLNHYRELPQEIQELVGPIPEGFNDYFASRFPRLLIEVYKVMCKYCKAEECFQRYFKNV
ncbi:serine/threonine-protein kinase/endoribonuclease IRE1a isoform X2 [Prosopis cineraria]|uniref:serine/threonine-protein kinase/endoribonuclease IRE1a isoform X2 n=1 Tax=Prosopis cineraria TaxID=364024 RepID=UPI00240EB795|nr:serine/threonine-protein kinase/endoribonuclease IRE1a isoform X2 [Prosopis cineraria]